MRKLKTSLKVISAILMLMLLVSCHNDVPSQSSSLTINPILLTEWRLGEVSALDWSPDSKAFAVNYSVIDEDEFSRVVQFFDVETTKSAWIAGDSLAQDLVLSSDGQFVVEANTNIPVFYWRDVENGIVSHFGELTDIGQMKQIDCQGGGQIMVTNAKRSVAIIADHNTLLSPRKSYIVPIRQLDLETGECSELLDYHGFLNLLDINSDGTLLVYGGSGKDDMVVVWDLEKKTEVCHTEKVEFGRFVPGTDHLVVIKEQKTIFIDALTCQKIRSLDISPFSNHETYLAFSSNGEQFALARDSVQVMAMPAGDLIAEIPFPEDSIPIALDFFWSGIEFSPDGRYLTLVYYLLDGSGDNMVQLWQLKP